MNALSLALCPRRRYHVQQIKVTVYRPVVGYLPESQLLLNIYVTTVLLHEVFRLWWRVAVDLATAEVQCQQFCHCVSCDKSRCTQIISILCLYILLQGLPKPKNRPQFLGISVKTKTYRLGGENMAESLLSRCRTASRQCFVIVWQCIETDDGRMIDNNHV